MSAKGKSKISASKFLKQSARAKPGELGPAVMPQFVPMQIPPWIRLPKPRERCRFTQLSRTSMAETCIPTEANGFRPPVRGAVLLKSIATKKNQKPARGKKRGISADSDRASL